MQSEQEQQQQYGSVQVGQAQPSLPTEHEDPSAPPSLPMRPVPHLPAPFPPDVWILPQGIITSWGAPMRSGRGESSPLSLRAWVVRGLGFLISTINTFDKDRRLKNERLMESGLFGENGVKCAMKSSGLVSHYSAIGDTISCDAPYSAIGIRGKLFLRYPPS